MKMKLSLRQKIYLSFGLMLSIIPIVLLSSAMDWPTGFGLCWVPLIAGGILGIRWIRCPHCGGTLDVRGGLHPFCAECGERIDYDAK